MNSARSRGSQSSRYRRVGSGREVDESLFGASPRTRNAGASIVSGATLNTLRDSNATFVSSGDLQRIMQSTRIETNESIRMKQEAQEEELAGPLQTYAFHTVTADCQCKRAPRRVLHLSLPLQLCAAHVP